MKNGSGRLDVLDVFRGLAVAGMILVTSPGDWMHAYWWLQHAHWQGWTPADMVFPGFLVAVGVALGLSSRAISPTRGRQRRYGGACCDGWLG